jgi:hypothetical protein
MPIRIVGLADSILILFLFVYYSISYSRALMCTITGIMGGSHNGAIGLIRYIYDIHNSGQFAQPHSPSIRRYSDIAIHAQFSAIRA